MKKSKPKKRFIRKQTLLFEKQEIEILNSWIESQRPESGSNPLSVQPPPEDAPVGRSVDGSFTPYAGSTRFDQLPISLNTRDALQPKYTVMSEIQRASLPHSLSGRDVLGAAKTGSGKTLAFLIPVLENLYRARWGLEDGVGCIIISPTRELAMQLFNEFVNVGKFHNLSAGLLIGGCKGVDTEKDLVNNLNVIICTPGRLLQHMDETPNFHCSQLKILVLDEADRILDAGFKKVLNAILLQLPKKRQTLLFSATQSKSVQDLARLSLKDPEYLSVHAESITATPECLHQKTIVVPLDRKLDMLWSFIKAHLNSKILVFLSTCKQVRFVYEAFKKLRPGIPLKCLHGRMKQKKRMGTYDDFFGERSVLFSTDVASRGLDFPDVDWVVQVDCPDDVPAYIHRVGRTARFSSVGKSVLFIMPSEMQMIKKLEDAKIPIHTSKPNKLRLQSISGLLASLLVKYPNLQHLALRALATYLKSIYLQKDKEVFDVEKLAVEEFSVSLGLPMVPKLRFLNRMTDKKIVKEASHVLENSEVDKIVPLLDGSEEESENDLLSIKDNPTGNAKEEAAFMTTRISKKKKLKINLHRPVGTRIIFDEEGNTLPPLAAVANSCAGDSTLEVDKVKERYAKLKEEMRRRDNADKILHRRRLQDLRSKERIKLKRARAKDKDGDMDDSDGEPATVAAKRSKIYFNSDSDEEKVPNKIAGCISDSVTLAEQEALALKLLSSMHS